MTDRLTPLSLSRLMHWALADEEEGHIYGIYREQFFKPSQNDPFRVRRYGQLLETPIGVAAGPHTQMAQTIVCAWLTGARYIELKTVQTLDQIEVAKPCIDMQDEGYNCEWSQELRLEESFDEYLKAWVLLHLLKDRFGWGAPEEPGFIFNMSVGYDLKGIMQPNVQRFLDLMADAQEPLERAIGELAECYPRAREVAIPTLISDNITLSTMHGCPPAEIEQIGRYLITERRLHTAIKLNPTLLGPERLRDLLNRQLGYEVEVPDSAFEHDPDFTEVVRFVRQLQSVADEAGVSFAVKLTNTLEVLNRGEALPPVEKQKYLSGRALHPLSIDLAALLQAEFDGGLDISFCAGVDYLNVVDSLAGDLGPVTVCSDLLKPGGYYRLGQYLEEIENACSAAGADDLAGLIKFRAGGNTDVNQAALANLQGYAQRVVGDERYHKSTFPYSDIKTSRPLTAFDCIQAPCVETCAVEQAVPEYMHQVAEGDLPAALTAVRWDNPLPQFTGLVCDHLCQSKCVRMNYDQPLAIREIKRFVAEQAGDVAVPALSPHNGLKVAIIGAGPSGLACAWFLAVAGFEVEVYEGSASPGGLVAQAIPAFRLPDEAVRSDMAAIRELGVKIHLNQPVDGPLFKRLRDAHDYLYIAVGARRPRSLGVPGEQAVQVHEALDFLTRVRAGERIPLGARVLVIGGGNTAVDAARTARRLMADGGQVTVVYRRTRREMPVGLDEAEALDNEGIELLELAAPVKVRIADNLVTGLTVSRMRLGEPEADGRRRPVPVPDSEFDLPADDIIVAIGQEADVGFVRPSDLAVDPSTNETQLPGVYAGGDVVRGAGSLINAMADGKRVAESIGRRAGRDHGATAHSSEMRFAPADYERRLARREPGIKSPEPPADLSIDQVPPTFDQAAAQAEADRCLRCDDYCNICVTVCPDRAMLAYQAEPLEITLQRGSHIDGKLEITDSGTFRIVQRPQVLVIADLCNECGDCTTFCPTSGQPFQDKPRLCLTEASFDIEDNCYYLKDGVIKRRLNGQVETLTDGDDYLVYETDNYRARLARDTLQVLDVQPKTGEAYQLETDSAAAMYVLMISLKGHSLFSS